MARCAVCQGSIRNGDQFGFEDIYVIHRRCRGGQIFAQRQLSELAAQRLSADARADNAVAERDRARDELARLRRERIDRADHVVQVTSDLSDARSRIAQLEEQVQSERNLRALAELEARSIRQPQAQQPQTEPEQISDEPVDITAQRFRLLELD